MESGIDQDWSYWTKGKGGQRPDTRNPTQSNFRVQFTGEHNGLVFGPRFFQSNYGFAQT